MPQLSLFYVIHPAEEAVPAYALEAVAVRIARPPDEDGLAHYVVLRHETPVTGVGGVMTVVSLHPVVVHLEGVFLCLLAVDEYLAVVGNLEVIALIYT